VAPIRTRSDGTLVAMKLPPAEPAVPEPSGDDRAADHAADTAADEVERRQAAARRLARLERIFGTEPLSTRDDLPDPEPSASSDDWYRENRPPHYG
jgi:hypothetical protein